MTPVIAKPLEAFGRAKGFFTTRFENAIAAVVGLSAAPGAAVLAKSGRPVLGTALFLGFTGSAYLIGRFMAGPRNG